MPDYIPRYRAHFFGDLEINSPSLDDLDSELSKFPPESECWVGNANGTTQYSGTVQQVREDIREALFPTPATRKDVARLEAQITELRQSIDEMRGLL